MKRYLPSDPDLMAGLMALEDTEKVALANWLLSTVNLSRPRLKGQRDRNQPQRVEGGQWSHS